MSEATTRPADAGFRRLVIGRSVSSFGDGLVITMIPFAALTLGAGPAQLGLVLLACRVPQFVLMPFGGMLGDWLPRKLIAVSADVFRLAVQTATMVLLLTGHCTLLLLAVAQALTAAAGAFSEPAGEGLITETVRPAKRARVNAVLGMARSVALVVGPAFGAAIVTATGPAVAFGVDAATFGISAIALAGLRTIRRGARREKFFASAIGGWSEFRRRRWLWASTLLMMLVNGGCIAPLLVIGPLVTGRQPEGATLWSLIMAAQAAGGLVGGLVAYRLRPRRPMLATMVLPVLLLPFPLALAWAAPMPVVMTAALFSGLQAAMVNIFFATTRQNQIPDEVMSRTSSIAIMTGMAVLPIGMGFGGLFASLVGSETVLLVGAALCLAVPSAALLVPDIRNLPPGYDGADDRAKPDSITA